MYNKYVCGWCGKYSYTNRNSARDAVRKLVKSKGLETHKGSFYRCHFDRKVWHITSWTKDRTDRYQAYIRNDQVRDLENNSLVRSPGTPASEASYWRWVIFDSLGRFGVKSARTIKLSPERWSGIVNKSPWAIPAIVTVTSRKRNRKGNRS